MFLFIVCYFRVYVQGSDTLSWSHIVAIWVVCLGQGGSRPRLLFFGGANICLFVVVGVLGGVFFFFFHFFFFFWGGGGGGEVDVCFVEEKVVWWLLRQCVENSARMRTQYLPVVFSSPACNCKWKQGINNVQVGCRYRSGG